ncbi:hypothetical protein Paride_0369 [Pseudomonas phage Paride]|nr:hypothetical protein Paride_0369 [Pseudomonas phage Paride]
MSNVSIPAVTVENIGTLRIVRTANKEVGSVLDLKVNGVVVGQAFPLYSTKTQRSWNASMHATVNGVEVQFAQEGVFSAIRIARAFEDAVKYAVSNGEQGQPLPAPAAQTDAPATAEAQAEAPAAQTEDAPETPAAEAKPARKGGSKGSSKGGSKK